MAASHLRHYISLLESSSGLSRIAVSVDPVLEIAAITRKVCKQQDGGTALLFEHPTSSSFQVATNLFGSQKRVCQALGIKDLTELTVRMRALLDLIPECDITSLDSQIVALPVFNQYTPHTDSEPDPSQIPMIPPDLNRFPFLQNWPDDGATTGNSRYVTLPQVFTTDPDGGTPNCGVYRVQLRGQSEVAIQWKAGSGAARHAELHQRLGKAMPVAVVLGGDPAILFSAMFPLPGNLDEMTFAGFLRGAPLATVPCRSLPLQVPSGAEIVIEGYVETGETVFEGPFGNHTGYYSPAAPSALLRVTAISHRPDAVIPATVVGPPPMEDCWMSLAWERLLLAFLQKLVPSIKNIHFPFEWVFHQSIVISLENPQPGMVRSISAQLWKLPWLGAARVLLFVAADGEPIELSRAAWKFINVTDYTDDIFHDSASARVAIDATDCRLRRHEVKISTETAHLVSRRWKEYQLP